MTQTPAFEDLLALVQDRSDARRSSVAGSPDLDVRVPSCPDWSLRDLVESPLGLQRPTIAPALWLRAALAVVLALAVGWARRRPGQVFGVLLAKSVAVVLLGERAWPLFFAMGFLVGYLAAVRPRRISVLCWRHVDLQTVTYGPSAHSGRMERCAQSEGRGAWWVASGRCFGGCDWAVGAVEFWCRAEPRGGRADGGGVVLCGYRGAQECGAGSGRLDGTVGPPQRRGHRL